MDARSLLDTLLQTTRDVGGKGLSMAEDKLGIPAEGSERQATLDGMGKGALAAGALALLLGTKGGRKLTGTALKAGGVAAVGALAFKAYNDWRNGSGDAWQPTHTDSPIEGPGVADADVRSLAMVRAMISAAKSDGHIDADERARILEQIRAVELDTDVNAFLLEELDRPADATAIAAMATSQEMAAELYLASVMVVERDTPEEELYLAQLASALGLDGKLVQLIEGQLA